MSDSRQNDTKVEEVKRVGRVRVYEVAKELGVSNKDLVSKVQSLGITIKNHMSSLDMDDMARVKSAMEKERQENLEEKRLTTTVIRRRSKVKRIPAAAQPPAEEQAAEAQAAPAPAAEVEDQAPEVQPSAAEAQAPAADVEVQAPADEQAVEAQAPEVQPPAAEAQAPAAEAQAPVAEAQAPAADGKEQQAQPAQSDPPAAEGTAPASKAATPAAAKPAAAPAEAKQPGAKPTDGKPKVEVPKHRYAPGFKPGMTFGRDGRPTLPPRPRPSTLKPTEDQPISAADALRMMAPAQKPRVVITDLDSRRPGARREVVTRKDLFSDRRFRGPGKKRRKTVSTKKSRKTEITTPAQHKRVIRLQDAIAVGEIARQMGIKAPEVLKRLWSMGLTNININQNIDADTASLLAAEYGYEIEDVAFKEEKVLMDVEDKPEDLISRPPVVTVMGHVDHGKTSLLDNMRNTQVAEGEAGGITQHIGASMLHTPGGDIVFLDTPGHAAFTHMRARGAQCTDIVVLVVAANDGVMPQTVEALDHAKDAGVPIIVAVNKIDLPDANPDRVRNELAERGLVPEEWGGETLFVNVSARTREGLDSLVDSINLQAELMELRANPSKPAKGTIIESRLDKARGAMSSVLIQEGTLRVGDNVVTGEHMGKVRAMLDDRGKQLKEAGPCSPVEVLGLGGVPEAGDTLNAVTDEKAARVLVEHRQDQHRQTTATASAGKTYEEILATIKSGEAKDLKLLLKADVQGSSEAVREALTKLATVKVSVTVISANVGGITENDINLAKASGAIVMGFNVRAPAKTTQAAEREGVEIRTYDVIYEMLDEVQAMMQGLLPKERREKFMGRAEVRETFTIPKVGTIAGCSLQEGKITRNSQLRLVRDNIKIYDGKVKSLRRFKDDVKEVVQGYECGIGIEGYNDIKVGDVIEAYDIEEVVASLR